MEGFQANIQDTSNQNDSLDHSNIDNLAKLSANKSLITLYERGLRKTEVSLEKIQKEKAATLEKYEGLDKNELLVKKAIAKFSYFNPKLNTRQERTETFVLSKDGSEVLGRISNGKMLVRK
jgi:aspartate oxidase